MDRSAKSLRAMWIEKLGLPKDHSAENVDELIDDLFSIMEVPYR